MTTQIERYLDSIQATARGVEEHARNVGYYTRDCDMLDNALKNGMSGVVILFKDGDVNAEPEIHSIGRSNAKVNVERGKGPDEWSLTYHPEWKREKPPAKSTAQKEMEAGGGNARMALDPYEQVEPRAFQRAAAQSHEHAKAAGPTPTQKLTGDALRAKQVRDSAREKANRLAEYERNERIAAAAKAASDKMWNRSA